MLTLAQINLLGSLIQERQCMTEKLIYFCHRQWMYTDKKARLAYMEHNWNTYQLLLRELESMKESNMSDFDQFDEWLFKDESATRNVFVPPTNETKRTSATKKRRPDSPCNDKTPPLRRSPRTHSS
jgi:hypothetical protein